MPDAYSFLLDAPVGEPRARIQIAKLGKGFKDPRYGKFDITEGEVQSWRSNLARLPGGRAPIDFDHLADKPGAARNTEAAGWITNVALQDGVPVADVEWTPKGESAIRDKRYLFFSPTYGPYSDETGAVHKDTLIGGALTNRPFLNMSTVCLASAPFADDAEFPFALDRLSDDELHELDGLTADQRNALPASAFVFPDTRRYPIHDESHARNALARSSGKPEEAAVKAAVYKRYPQLRPKQMENEGAADSRPAMPDFAKIAKALGLPEDTDEAKILEALAEREEADETETKTLEVQAAEAGKVVLDKGEHDELKGKAGKAEALETRVQSLEKQAADEKFDAAYDKALTALSVDAKEETRTEWRELYDAAPDATLKRLAAQTPVANGGHGSGGHAAELATDVPEWDDADGRKELHVQIQARMADKDEDYVTALQAVTAGSAA